MLVFYSYWLFRFKADGVLITLPLEDFFCSCIELIPFLGLRDEAIIMCFCFMYMSLPVLSPSRPKLEYRPTGVYFPAAALSGVPESYTEGRKLSLEALPAPGVRRCDLRC